MTPHFDEIADNLPSTPTRSPEQPLDPESQLDTTSPPQTWHHKLWIASKRHANFVGPGILASVAYFDPGNWATDLAAGSQFGYSLLFVVLCAGIGAILFQVLSCRLGIVTGKDLAQQLRALLHSREKHQMLWRWGALYPLYVLSELAIIATDLAELLGSAIALNLLFPRLPLYAGVLLTASDVLVVLIAYRPNGGARSMRIFEVIIAILVIAVFVSFIVLTFRIRPDWSKAFYGYVPSKELAKPGALYAGIGIVGATVMPHALYLGSRLSTMSRLPVVAPTPPVPSPPALSMMASTRTSITAVDRRMSSEQDRDKSALDNLGIHLKRLLFESESTDEEKAHTAIATANLRKGDHGLTSVNGDSKVAFIRTHVRHASWDIILSLFGFAVTINSAILIVASAAFYYGVAGGTSRTVGDLFEAYHLIKEYMGGASAFLFAFALLCAGQSASITVTLAGQVISEGFLQWNVSPFVRRVFTRLIGIIPSVIISVSLGRSGIDSLLIASQVVLSMILPFVVFPLVWITSERSGIMRVWLTSEGNTGEKRRGELDSVQCEGGSDLMGVTCPPSPLPDEARGPSPLRTSPSSNKCLSSDPQPTLTVSHFGRLAPCTKLPPSTSTSPSLLSPPLSSPSPLRHIQPISSPSLPLTKSHPQPNPAGRFEDFSSPWYVTAIGYVLVVIMLAANVYVVVELAMGSGA
ncbi:hypothetical protein FRB96_009527 [Tulasnella sp. 330]|nr:hypothetical protein FRB96_009527 [Tulasnella sp. 330]KAG8870017.1 hypothetical protein FRB98_001941 [Tulasnella sp. 332]